MAKRIFVIIMVFCFLTGCTSRQSQQNQQSEASTSPLESSSETSKSDVIDTPTENVAPDDNNDIDTDDSDSSIEDVRDNAIFSAVNDVITAYESGNITTNDMYQSLPDGFSFPKNRSVNDIEINPIEEVGGYNVVITSVDKEWDMVIFVDSFTFVDADGNATGGTPTVRGVAFLER